MWLCSYAAASSPLPTPPPHTTHTGPPATGAQARSVAAYNAELREAEAAAARAGRSLPRHWRPRSKDAPRGFGHPGPDPETERAVAEAVARTGLLDYAEMGQVVVLKKFWASRAGLLLEPPLPPDGSPPDGGLGPGGGGAGEAQRGEKRQGAAAAAAAAEEEEEEEEETEAPPSGSEGLHARLRGVEAAADQRRDLLALPAPLLLVASAEDRWVLPAHADAIASAMAGWKYGDSPEVRRHPNEAREHTTAPTRELVLSELRHGARRECTGGAGLSAAGGVCPDQRADAVPGPAQHSRHSSL